MRLSKWTERHYVKRCKTGDSSP